MKSKIFKAVFKMHRPFKFGGVVESGIVESGILESGIVEFEMSCYFFENRPKVDNNAKKLPKGHKRIVFNQDVVCVDYVSGGNVKKTLFRK